jgi:leucyl aminopeptidase
MKVSITSLALNDLDVDLVIVPLTEEQSAETLGTLADELGAAFTRALDDFGGKTEQTLLVYPENTRARRFLLVGLGLSDDVTMESLREAAAGAADAVSGMGIETIALTTPRVSLDLDSASQALVEGFMLASYRYLQYKTTGDRTKPVERIVMHGDKNDTVGRRGAERGRIVAESVMLARDLVNRSPHDKTPTMLAREIEKIGKKAGFEVSVWDKAVIEEEKMGGLLAVNRGSVEPPTFSVLEYKPENAVNDRPVALVGKGIVFDTGGLSLKPTKDSMDHMKADMGGAAAVVGAMDAIARLNVPLHVIAFIPATDNRPGGNAYVPGDVVTMHDGTTVEVLNTDAEGRMILADALSYAKTYNPMLTIDVATLTGSQVVALGGRVASVMTSADSESTTRLEELEEAGLRSGDMVARLPFHAFYKKQLDSEVADMKNVGGREAGSITAGKFLEHFAPTPFVHVDIAGPGWTGKKIPYRPVGGTGFGVRLLVEYLRGLAAPKKSKK